MKAFFKKAETTMSAAAVLVNIPAVKNGPTLKAAGGKLREFEERLRAVRLEMSQLSGGSDNGCLPMPPVARFDREGDARALVSGEKTLVDLVGVNGTTSMHDLVRQKMVLETTIELQREIVRKAEVDTIYRICTEHRDEILPFFQRAIDAFARLEKDLLELEAIHSGLQTKGLRPECRPTGLLFTDYERAILRGAQGQCSLDWFIKNRRETLGLTNDNPKGA